MRRVTLSVLLAVILTPVLVSGADAPAAKRATTRAAVRAVVQALVDATNKADVNAMMELYSRRPEVSSIGEGVITRGWDAIHTLSGQMEGKEGSYTVSAGPIDVTPLGASYALAVFPLTIKGATPQGTVELPGAASMILEKSGSTWKILNDHTSTNWPNPGQKED